MGAWWLKFVEYKYFMHFESRNLSGHESLIHFSYLSHEAP